MLNDTLSKIEAKIQTASHLAPEKKTEILQLITDLRTEVSKLSPSQADQAESIVGFTRLSAHEAMRPVRDDTLRDLAVEGLSASVRQFEQSHPRLVDTVNGICVLLSNLGI